MSPLVKRRNGKQLRRGNYALPAATMNAYLEHALSLPHMTALTLPYRQSFALITKRWPWSSGSPVDSFCSLLLCYLHCRKVSKPFADLRRRKRQIGRRLSTQALSQLEAVTADAQQEAARRVHPVHQPISVQQSSRRHRMAGIAVVVRSDDRGELERRCARHIRIDEQHRSAPLQVGDMLH